MTTKQQVKEFIANRKTPPRSSDLARKFDPLNFNWIMATTELLLDGEIELNLDDDRWYVKK